MTAAAPLLDNYTNISTETAAGRVKSASTFLHKLQAKHKLGLSMAYDLKDYLKEKGVKLAGNWKATRETVFRDMNSPVQEYRELANLYFQLTRTGMGVGTLFEQGGSKHLFAAGVFYSKHRFSPVWCYRKSRMIRGCYARWVDENLETLRTLTPIHLVLTVPHTSDGFRGQEFYARAIADLYRTMRREKFWKEHVKGGEYCLEVTRNENGFHIHIHSLVFQSNDITVNAMREKVRQAWQRLVGGDDFVMVHYETLYYKDRENPRIVEHTTGESTYGIEINEYDIPIYSDDDDDYGGVQVMDYNDTGEVTKTTKYYDKVYINKHSTADEWIFGILECVKYHFKEDTAVIERTVKGRAVFDIDLIKDILNNTKNMRMYDRFGFLRKEPLLNFSRLEKQKEEVVTEETGEDEGSASIANFEANLIDPFTLQPAEPGSYKVVYFHLAFIQSAGSKESGYKVTNLDKRGIVRDAGCSPSEAFRAVLSRMIYQTDFYKLLTG